MSARKARAVVQPIPQSSDIASLSHGGDLAAARRLFPGAPEPFIDLSTGINPHSYPVPQLSSEVFARLPEPGALDRVATAAAAAYGAPSRRHVVPAPGTQILLAAIAAQVAPGRAVVLGPTYGEFARAAALAGHCATEVTSIARLADADLAIAANPNNPDGRILRHAELLGVADALRSRGGMLVIDEAFMDVGPPDASLGGEVARGNIVVLRSFGKFYGLAGVRLGFALAAPDLVARLAAWLGPWAVSGPALAIGAVALADAAWAQAMRARLAADAHRLDAVLAAAQLEVVGGTLLFRLVETHAADDVARHLGRAGIWVRRFAERPNSLRFGLPADEAAWERLRTALSGRR
jgi:cobalamin biosynthetic protein CobC